VTSSPVSAGLPDAGGKTGITASWRLAHEIPFSWGRLGYALDLFIHLVSLEMRLLYKRSWLGVFWTLLNPLIQLVVFSLIFSHVLSVAVPRYPLFLCCGLLCWNAITESLTMAAGSIVNARNVLYQLGFPPAMMPLVVVTVGLIHFIFSLSILAVLLAWYKVPMGWPLAALPLIIGIQGLFTLALAFPLAALHAKFHDVRHLLAVAFRFMFFLTPILYASNAFPHVHRMFYAANPLTHLIEGYRAVLMDGAWPDWQALAGVTAASIIVLVFGFRYFQSRRFQFIEDL